MDNGLLLRVMLATVISSAVHAQVRPAPGVPTRTPVLRGGTALVNVPVSVRTQFDAAVRGLPKQSFRVYVDGIEREIRAFSEEETAVSIGIVFDASRSMETRLVDSREAVERLFKTELPGDEYQVVTFSDAPRVRCRLTPDTEYVRDLLKSVKAQGWTSLYDGIYLSARSMKEARNARRILVVLSDGEDNRSRYTGSEVQRYLREAGVMVFALGLSGKNLANLRYRALRGLADDTGGWFKAVDDRKELDEAVTEISLAARSYYLLGIPPETAGMHGKYHRVRVTVDSPRDRLRVSFRSGYYETE